MRVARKKGREMRQGCGRRASRFFNFLKLGTVTRHTHAAAAAAAAAAFRMDFKQPSSLLLSHITGRTLAAHSRSQAESSSQNQKDPSVLNTPMSCRTIGMLIFPRLTQLDMTGPFEVVSTPLICSMKPNVTATPARCCRVFRTPRFISSPTPLIQ
jgi:hypothetical protein